MFKKKTIKKKPQAIRRRSSDSDDDSDNDDAAARDTATTQEKLAQTRKKRKLLTAAQYKRGVDTAQLLTVQNSDATTATTQAGSVTKTGTAVKTAAETSRDGALDRKHRQAMEAFIEQRMTMNNSTGKNEETTAVTATPQQQLLTEDALYMDLAAQAARLAGKEQQQQNEQAAADQEERGAVLVAGTGIAEVILPVTERLRVVQETQQAAAAAATRRTKAKPQSTAIPNRFAMAYKPQEFPTQYGRENDTLANQRGGDTNSVSADATTTTDADAARPGFDAVRQQPQRPAAAAQNLSRRDQASDHKVFAKFVTRQRELRK